MSDPQLARLLAIKRGSADQNSDQWRAVEESLALRLPGSYKALVDAFEASSWRDFLRVLSPFDDRCKLQRIGNQVLNADRVMRSEFPWHYPLPLYPEKGGLLPWAVTDNGDTLYFVTAGSPDEWPTLIKGARAPEFEVIFLHPSLLVHHFAAGSLRSIVLRCE